MQEHIRFLDAARGEILYDGPGEVSRSSQATLVRFGTQDHSYTFRIKEDSCRICSESDVRILLKLEEGKPGSARIRSQEGSLELACFCHVYSVAPGRMEIGYTLEGQDQPFHFLLETEIKEEKNAPDGRSD